MYLSVCIHVFIDVCLHLLAWVTCTHVADGVGESAVRARQQVTDMLSALAKFTEVVECQGVSAEG